MPAEGGVHVIIRRPTHPPNVGWTRWKVATYLSPVAIGQSQMVGTPRCFRLVSHAISVHHSLNAEPDEYSYSKELFLAVDFAGGAVMAAGFSQSMNCPHCQQVLPKIPPADCPFCGKPLPQRTLLLFSVLLAPPVCSFIFSSLKLKILAVLFGVGGSLISGLFCSWMVIGPLKNCGLQRVFLFFGVGALFCCLIFFFHSWAARQGALSLNLDLPWTR
jgi:hypothetical protein